VHGAENAFNSLTSANAKVMVVPVVVIEVVVLFVMSVVMHGV
jgi:hypothetical protein